MSTVVLDNLCEDQNGNRYNLEVQKKDNDDHQKRVRYNIANIDTSFTEQGVKFESLPNIFAIYISKSDFVGKGKTIYRIKRSVSDTDDTVYNGIYEVYVNVKVDDGSSIAELMKYFVNSNGWNEKFPNLSARVKYLKEEQEGVNEMCELVENYANKKANEKAKIAEKQVILHMIRNQIDLNTIVKCVSLWNKDEVYAMYQEIRNAG